MLLGLHECLDIAQRLDSLLCQPPSENQEPYREEYYDPTDPFVLRVEPQSTPPGQVATTLVRTGRSTGANSERRYVLQNAARSQLCQYIRLGRDWQKWQELETLDVIATLSCLAVSRRERLRYRSGARLVGGSQQHIADDRKQFSYCDSLHDLPEPGLSTDHRVRSSDA